MPVSVKTATKRETELREQVYVHAILAFHKQNATNVKRLRSRFYSNVPLGAELLQMYVRDDHVHLLLAYPLTISTLQLISEYMAGTGVLKPSLECIEKLMNATLQDCLVRIGGWVSMKRQSPGMSLGAGKEFRRGKAVGN